MTNIIKKGFFPLLSALFIILLVTLASASVFINEIELNPEGTDSGNEWVEIFATSNTNISEWYLTDRDNNRFYFPNISISENSFYALDGLGADEFANTNENITLYNRLNVLQDEALGLSDSDNDNQTWQRVQDGNGGFVFKNSTKGVSNQLTLISSKAHYPGCLVKGDEVILSANVTGFCVNEVIFSVFTRDGQLNITGNTEGSSNYTAAVNTSLIDAYNNVLWTVYVKNCFNQTASDGNEFFYLNNRTELLVNSSTPDGTNGWYLTEPLFILENGDALQTSYRWNGNFFTYTSMFDLDGAPNNGNITGGTQVLRYWSDFSCKTENEQVQVFKFDFLAPTIIDLTPGSSSIINNVNPEISAYFDEVYQGNSGVNTSTLSMMLDNESVSFTNKSFGLDAKIKYNANNLSEGIHTVKVSAMDKAGHYSELEWIFEVNLTGLIIDLSVNSPVNELYDNKNVPINVTLNKEAKYIKYINHNDKRPSWKVLCTNCDNYGEASVKTKRLLEGDNNLSFMAIDSSGNEFTENVFIFIDSIAPKIKEVEPKKGYIDSSFNVDLVEANPVKMFISYTNGTATMTSDVNLSECTAVKSIKSCNAFIDLSEFNDQSIDYYADLTDIMNKSVQSKINRVIVDSVTPVINSVDFTSIGKRVELKIAVNESNLDEISYIDLNDRNPRERRLCAKLDSDGMCTKIITFRNGEHDLTIYAYDKAGNTAFVNNIEFHIV